MNLSDDLQGAPKEWWHTLHKCTLNVLLLLRFACAFELTLNRACWDEVRGTLNFLLIVFGTLQDATKVALGKSQWD